MAWDAYSSYSDSRVIIHRLGTAWSFGSQYWVLQYQSEDRPSISGLTGNTAHIVYQTGTTFHFNAHFNGTSWSVQFPAISGFHPSLSMGSTSAKYVWTSGTSSPYTINLSTNTFQKPAESNPYIEYDRSVALVDTATGAWLDVRVEKMALKTTSPTSEEMAFVDVPSSLELTPGDAFDALSTQPTLVPAGVETLIVHYGISGEKLSSVKNAPSSLGVELLIVEPGGHTTSVPVFRTDRENVEKTELKLALAISAFTGKEITLKTRVVGTSSRPGLVASLGHIYRILDTEAPEGQRPQTVRLQSEAVMLQAYPNPFNPYTTIHFSLPEAGMVTVRIYNIQGQLVRELLDEYRNAGQYTLQWEGRDTSGKLASSGMYILSIETPSKRLTSKILLMR